MTDTLPDRLSTNPKSPFYDEKLLQQGVGIKFDGQEKTNVEEYCVSEGWIRVAVGKTVDELAVDTTGAEVTAVRRRDIKTQEPSADMRLEAGDVVVLLGAPEALALAEERLLKG